MRSGLVVRASDCQCTSCNGPGFDPSILRHSGTWGAADESVSVAEYCTEKKENIPQKILKKKINFVNAYDRYGSQFILLIACWIWNGADIHDDNGLLLQAAVVNSVLDIVSI